MEDASTRKMARIIYVLYLVGFVLPICSIMGVIFGYIYEADAKDYLQSHFRYQIRGFWINMLYYVIAIVLCVVLVGFVLLPLAALWWIIRNVKGFRCAGKEQAIANPTTWFF